MSSRSCSHGTTTPATFHKSTCASEATRCWADDQGTKDKLFLCTSHILLYYLIDLLEVWNVKKYVLCVWKCNRWRQSPTESTTKERPMSTIIPSVQQAEIFLEFSQVGQGESYTCGYLPHIYRQASASFYS